MWKRVAALGWIARALGTLLVVAAVLAPAARAATRAETGGGEEPVVERLEAWPELDKDCRKGLKGEVDRLRKARTESMGASAADNLRACGAGVAPALLTALGKERDEEARARVLDVLASVTGAAHTRLLAAEFDHSSAEVRRFALQRVAGLPDPGVREPAERALAALEERGEKADAKELYLAALCATSAGSMSGFDRVLAAAEKDWRRRGPELRVALLAVRGPAASERSLAALEAAGDSSARTVAALNVLAACGEKDAARAVRPRLDSDDNSVRVAAINALRGVVDGDPPLENLPVFEAIEAAKRWKARELP